MALWSVRPQRHFYCFLGTDSDAERMEEHRDSGGSGHEESGRISDRLGLRDF